MSAQPIEPGAHPPIDDLRKTSDNRIAVESMLAYLELPAPNLVPRPDAVHITVTDVDDLGAWVYALGGEVRRSASSDGAALWTLHTETPTRRNGSKVEILVHAVVVDGDDVLVDVRRRVVTSESSSADDLVDPNGRVWHPTEHTRSGSALYVPDGIDPDRCPRLAMSTRTELEGIFGTEMRPLGGVA